MNELQQLEKTLAELLGWVYEDYQLDGNYVWWSAEGCRLTPPRWTTDDAAAFQLLVEHKIDLLFVHNATVEAVYKYDYKEDNASEFVYECISHHSDAQAATRVAIVKAVIAKLESTK